MRVTIDITPQRFTRENLLAIVCGYAYGRAGKTPAPTREAYESAIVLTIERFGENAIDHLFPVPAHVEDRIRGDLDRLFKDFAPHQVPVGAAA